MSKKTVGACLFLGLFLLSSCGPKKKVEELVPPVSQAQLRAEEAMRLAEEAIEDARSLGADTNEAEDLLAKAKDSFEQGDFPSTVKFADQAKESAEKAKELFLAEESAREEAAREEAAEKVAAEERKFYTVGTWEHDRDCLWNIAKKKEIYNDPWKWKKIYKVNKDKIKNPDLIYPGQKFTIP